MEVLATISTVLRWSALDISTYKEYVREAEYYA